MSTRAMAEQLIYYAQFPVVRTTPFKTWRQARTTQINPDTEVAFTFLDTGQLADALQGASHASMAAHEMELRVQVLARTIQTIGGIPIVTDDELRQMKTEASQAAGILMPADADKEVGQTDRIGYLIRTIRRWPVHVTIRLYEEYIKQRNRLERSLSEEAGNSPETSQVESVGKSESGQDSPPSSRPIVTAD